MGTSGGIDRTGAAIVAQDFWRSDAGANQPNGVTDVTEAISRTGATGIGDVPSSTPVARLDVAVGGRSGTDPRSAATAFYATGGLPGMPAFNAAGLPTPPTIAEFRHSNQGQGIGFAFNGIYATGNIANQDFALLNKGAGIHWKGWQAATGGLLFIDDKYAGVPVAVGHDFVERWYCGGVELATEHLIVERANPNFVRKQWNITINNGTYHGMSLRPVNTVAGTEGVELWLDGNRIQRRKLVLFDNGVGIENFFGMGMAGGTLTYQVPSNTAAQAHGWYGGADQVMALFGNGQLRLQKDQQATVPATDVALFRDPVSGNIRQGPAGAVRAGWSGTGVTDAAGLLTLAIPAGRFAAAPTISAMVQKAAGLEVFDIRVTAVSATSVTVKVTKAVPVVVSLTNVLAAPVDANGETIHIQAQAVG